LKDNESKNFEKDDEITKYKDSIVRLQD